MKTESATQNGERVYALRKDIRPDPEQPRKEFPQAKLVELSENISAVGIIEDLLVRPDAKNAGKFMLVDGERRWRAAELARIERLPIRVRVMTDEEARRYQRVSGTQRENLTALEEAADLAKQLAERQAKDSKFSLEDLAKEIGMSRGTAYNRLPLTKLSPAVRKPVTEGEIDVSVALLAASIPDPEKQAEYVKTLTNKNSYEYPYSYRQAKELLEEKYRLAIAKPPFDVKRAYASVVVLVDGKSKPAICDTCPKRTGNMTAVFPELAKSPNVCTDPACFRAKAAAHRDAELSRAKAAGQKVVSPETFAKAGYNAFQGSADRCWQDAKSRTYGALAKAAGIAPTLTADRDGYLVEVYPKEDVAEMFKANKIRSNSGGSSGRDLAAERARKKKEQQFLVVAHAATGKILDTVVTAKGIHSKLWLWLSDRVAQENGIERTAFIAKRLGLCKTQTEANDKLEAWLSAKERTDLDRQRFIVESLLCATYDGGGWHSTAWEDHFKDLAKLAGVNLDKMLETQRAASKEKKGGGVKPKGKKRK